MNTIQPMGDNTPIAGTAQHPSTYRISSCPGCYAAVKWTTEEQTSWTCPNCGMVVQWTRYDDGHMFPYMRQHLSFHFPLKSLVLIVWSLVQWIDHHARLRKNLLYAFIKLLSWLP